jgi:hypothetical protein
MCFLLLLFIRRELTRAKLFEHKKSRSFVFKLSAVVPAMVGSKLRERVGSDDNRRRAKHKNQIFY